MGTILVTDDDSTCRDSIQRALEREGHTVEGAGNVDSAIDAVHRSRFDLIICDYRMPGKSGLDLLAELEQEGSRIPVLMISAFVDDQTELAARKLGAVGILRKPFRRQDLLDHAARAMQ